jgi:hypothetical protein
LECLSLSNVGITDGVISIGVGAFSTCNLASVDIPGSVTSIGDGAFGGCRGLTRAKFMGNAPAMGVDVFAQSAMGFCVYYYNGETGFTNPQWLGYPVRIATPAIALEQAGLEVTDGGAVNCGAVGTGKSESRYFTIRNTGEHDLTGVVLSIDGANSEILRSGRLGNPPWLPAKAPRSE